MTNEVRLRRVATWMDVVRDRWTMSSPCASSKLVVE